MTNIFDELKTDALALLAKIEGSSAIQAVEAEAEADYQAFLAKIQPLYTQLKTFAATQGKADVATLLSDLELGLQTSITTYLTTGGNIGAAVAATASAEIAKATADVTADGKNALYGGLAIVAANLTPAPTEPAPAA